ncbi:hypothetical protein K0M31_012657 [Melipona bicolor]|uniref:Uncharacterized protein n=1 Tax=Melipona bicolor TaxID=60889 RepID=A0AA40FJJ2_9HYME|nr:hypothetical protein K0M31_012657 [Melipona bicolor]
MNNLSTSGSPTEQFRSSSQVKPVNKLKTKGEEFFTQREDRSLIVQKTSDSEYESATDEISTASLESPTCVDFKAAFREAINTLPLEEGNNFQQVEKSIMALAEKDSIEGAEIDTMLEAFVQRLELEDSTKQRNAQHSKRCHKRGDMKKNTHNGRKRTLYALHSELFKKCPKKLVDPAIMGPNNDYKETKMEFPFASEVETLYREL